MQARSGAHGRPGGLHYASKLPSGSSGALWSQRNTLASHFAKAFGFETHSWCMTLFIISIFTTSGGKRFDPLISKTPIVLVTGVPLFVGMFDGDSDRSALPVGTRRAALLATGLERNHAATAVGLDLATTQEHLFQASAAAPHAGLRARDRQTEPMGRGAVGQSFKLGKFYSLPIGIGELTDHRGDAAGHPDPRIV